MKHLRIVLLVAISFFLLSCGGSSNSSTPSVTVDLGAAPTLTAADKNTVAPCPNQDLLTSATERAAIKDALLTGALAFLDVPFDATDADNFKKKCGLEGFWDPTKNLDEITPAVKGMTEVTLSQLLQNGNAGICTTGSAPLNFVTGFPVAGTYRTEIKAAKGGSTWHLRLRTVASGISAGEVYVIDPMEIENDFEYKVNGTVTTHAGLLPAIVNAVALSNDAVVFDVSKIAGDPSVFNGSLELICVTKS
jgi:hypothetical protein